MDSIESQITNASGAYNPMQDRYHTSWATILDLQNNFFTLQRKKEDIISWFEQLGELVKMKHIPVSSSLVDAEKLTKINPNLSTPKEGEKNIVES